MEASRSYMKYHDEEPLLAVICVVVALIGTNVRSQSDPCSPTIAVLVPCDGHVTVCCHSFAPGHHEVSYLNGNCGYDHPLPNLYLPSHSNEY